MNNPCIRSGFYIAYPNAKKLDDWGYTVAEDLKDLSLRASVPGLCVANGFALSCFLEIAIGIGVRKAAPKDAE